MTPAFAKYCVQLNFCYNLFENEADVLKQVTVRKKREKKSTCLYKRQYSKKIATRIL